MTPSRFCPAGHEVLAEHAFCTECGQPVVSAGVTPSGDAPSESHDVSPGPDGTFLTCPHCAESIRAEAKICRYCNRSVEPMADRLRNTANRLSNTGLGVGLKGKPFDSFKALPLKSKVAWAMLCLAGLAAIPVVKYEENKAEERKARQDANIMENQIKFQVANKYGNLGSIEVTCPPYYGGPATCSLFNNSVNDTFEVNVEADGSFVVVDY